jgi:transposase
VRSERLLMEQMKYTLLFRWLVGLEVDEPVWNHAVSDTLTDRLERFEAVPFLAALMPIHSAVQ